MKESKYPTNTMYQFAIEDFFRELGYVVEFGNREEAAIGIGQEIVVFKVPRFKPLDLEGVILEKWNRLPIEVID